jgi:ferric-dicitrate binding protein FerR (iron transport regulator)
MRGVPERCPADFVYPDLPDERLSGQWRGIERVEAKRQLGRKRRRQFVRIGMRAAIVVSLSTAAVFQIRGGSSWLDGMASVLGRDEQPAMASSSVANGDTRQLSLADGSTLVLSRDTRAQVVSMTPGEVRVRLELGEIECDVAHLPGRRFVVEAGEFEVVVRGTRFRVALASNSSASASVDVSVDSGLVEVGKPGEPAIAVLGPAQSLRVQHATWGSETPPRPSTR